MLWTSGVPCSIEDGGKTGKNKGKCKTATWCSTKTVSKLNYTLTKSKNKEENCLAMDMNKKKLVVSNCKNTGFVVCEVAFPSSSLLILLTIRDFSLCVRVPTVQILNKCKKNVIHKLNIQ